MAKSHVLSFVYLAVLLAIFQGFEAFLNDLQILPTLTRINEMVDSSQ